VATLHNGEAVPTPLK